MMKEKGNKYLFASGKVVLSDYREYANFDIFRGKFSRVVRVALTVWIILICAFVILLGFMVQNTMMILIAGIILLCLGSFVFMLRRQVKVVCIRKKPFLYATHEVRIGKNGLIYSVLFDPAHNPGKLEDSQEDFLFEDLFRAYETGGFFYFYLAKKTAIILPKRNMMPADSLELRALLQNKIGKKFIRCI